MDPTVDPYAAPPDESTQRDIAETEITRFFSAVCGTAVCELCGQQNWKMAHFLEKFSVLSAITAGKRVSVLGERGHVALNISCDTCGNLKLLLAGNVEAWLRRNPAGA